LVTNFQNLFQRCSSLTTIPTGLFDNCPNVTTFASAFSYCGLTSVPIGLFQNNTGVTTFAQSFYGCSLLTSIPTDLFSNCSIVNTFEYTFYNCISLISIPTDLFSNCPLVTTFKHTFYGCNSLISISENIFSGCTNVSTFESTFRGCSSLTTIPNNLFSAGGSSFWNTFYGCNSLTSIPIGLFDNCPTASNFNTTFAYCTSLTGYAPKLWLRTNPIPTGSGCFTNDILLDNYQYIPSGWGGGGYDPSLQIQVTTTGTSQTITIPHLTDYTHNYWIIWGDGSSNAVTGATDSRCTHTYAVASGYTIKINGICETFYINNTSNMKLLITNILSWGDVQMRVPNFYGCTNLVSYPTGTTSLVLSTFVNTFRDCTSLTGYAARLWNTYPTATATDCFTNATGMTNYLLIPSSWGGPGNDSSLKLEFTTVITGQTITIPHLNNYLYDYYIDWGDGSPIGHVISYSNTNTRHIYSEISGYTVTINGICETIYFNNGGSKLNLTKIINLGDVGLKIFNFYGCTNLNEITNNISVGLIQVSTFNFRGCTSLTSIPSDIFKYSTNVTTFDNVFYGCNKITEIPVDLFRYNTEVTSFVGTFQSCTSLVSGITADLFRYNTKITTLASVFNSCTKITEIPNDFISGLTSLTTLTDAFNSCVTLTKIGSNAFKNLPNLTAINTVFSSCPITIIGDSAFEKCSKLTTTFFTFTNNLTTIGNNAFKDCSGVTTGFASKFSNFSNLTSIGANIFSGCTAVTSFASTFQSCTSLTGITSNIFDTNTNVTTFQQTFYGCTSLTTIPDGLFKYNTLSTNFSNTFYNCTKLQVNPWTFYLSGEESTRFNGKTVNFTSCFQRTTFTGVQGTAPDLWNCTGLTSTKTNCFDGNGNSVTSLSNYNDIPIAWL